MKYILSQLVGTKKQRIPTVYLKLISLTLVIISIVLLLSSCSDSNQNIDRTEYTQDNVYFVDIQQDQYGNTISKSVYNRVTGHSYLYTYDYEFIEDKWVCMNSDVVSFTSSGVQIK